jgi:hypothetical protein
MGGGQKRNGTELHERNAIGKVLFSHALMLFMCAMGFAISLVMLITSLSFYRGSESRWRVFANEMLPDYLGIMIPCLVIGSFQAFVIRRILKAQR